LTGAIHPLVRLRRAVDPPPLSGGPVTPTDLADIERARLRALVAADIDVAAALHADDFQLITPSGRALSKAEYLGAIESGALRYLSWEPDEITVRLHGSTGVVRYQAVLQTASRGVANRRGRHWHTDAYELRDGRWQVVWSQATEIEDPTGA
jgi:Domain of unknown function (DUF4440)